MNENGSGGVTKTSRGPIWFGVALVVIVAGIGAWIYFLQPPGGLDLGIALSTNPANVLVGDPFTLSVIVTNNSASALENASISLVLPANISSLDSPDERVVTQPLGNLDGSGVSHQDFHLIVTGDPNTIADITAQVMYGASGSSAQFENDGSLEMPVGDPAVTVSLNTPQDVFSGQSFPIAVSYDNTTGHAVTGATLAVQYPPAYTFVKASSSLVTSGNDTWSLGTLAPDASGTITITGGLVGPDGASYPIAAALSENISGQAYPITSANADITLAASPLSFSISVNSGPNYISSPGDSLAYTLTFTNHASVTFQNIGITARLSGTMFDFSSLQTSGAFNSVADTVTWNGASSPQLLSLAPGQSGSVGFSIHTKSAFPIRLLSDKNYSVSVAAQAQSATVPPGTDASSTMSVTSLTTKLGGQIVLGEKGYWREPASGVGSLGPTGITNSGPYPPRVNQATQYTVHWLLTNYATDAQNVTITAFLQSGTTCTSKMKSPASSTLACNPANGEVTWQVPFVAATTGVTGKPLEAVFQIVNTPAVNEVGQDVTLVGAASLTATDAFTSSTLQSSVGPLTTALPDDMSVSTNIRTVMQ